MPSTKTPQLAHVMKEIATVYFRARRMLTNYPDVLTDSQFHQICSYIYTVLYSYTKLTSNEKQFLNNEYFYGANEGWWKSSLTEAQYKAMQKQSITNFMRNFYEVF